MLKHSKKIVKLFCNKAGKTMMQQILFYFILFLWMVILTVQMLIWPNICDWCIIPETSYFPTLFEKAILKRVLALPITVSVICTGLTFAVEKS